MNRNKLTIIEGIPLSVVSNCNEEAAYLAFVLEKSGKRTLFRVVACKKSSLSSLTEMHALIESKIHDRSKRFSLRKDKEIKCVLTEYKPYRIFKVKVDSIEVECEVKFLISDK